MFTSNNYLYYYCYYSGEIDYEIAGNCVIIINKNTRKTNLFELMLQTTQISYNKALLFRIA